MMPMTEHDATAGPPATIEDQPPRRPSGRGPLARAARAAWPYPAALLLTASLVGVIVLVLVTRGSWADAAGGCGGG